MSGGRELVSSEIFPSSGLIYIGKENLSTEEDPSSTAIATEPEKEVAKTEEAVRKEEAVSIPPESIATALPSDDELARRPVANRRRRPASRPQKQRLPKKKQQRKRPPVTSTGARGRKVSTAKKHKR